MASSAISRTASACKRHVCLELSVTRPQDCSKACNGSIQVRSTHSSRNPPLAVDTTATSGYPLQAEGALEASVNHGGL